MSKIEFRGEINGKVFDNVKAYNNEMNRLIEEGCTSINASSSTKSIEGDVQKDIPVATLVDTSVNFLPGFERDGENYLNILVGEDLEKNKKTLENLQSYLNNQAKILKKSINSMNMEDLDNYLKDVEDGLAIFNSDIQDHNGVVEDLEKEIKDLQDNIEEAKDCICVSLEYKKFYDGLKNYILDTMSGKQIHNCGDGDCGCNDCDGKCNCCNDEKVDHDKVINNIIDAIYPKLNPSEKKEVMEQYKRFESVLNNLFGVNC